LFQLKYDILLSQGPPKSTKFISRSGGFGAELDPFELLGQLASHLNALPEQIAEWGSRGDDLLYPSEGQYIVHERRT
jgi:hypothetical protein